MERDGKSREAALLRRAAAGSRDAWAELYDLHQAELQRRVRARLGSAHLRTLDSQEVLQSVWRESLKSLQQFEYRGDGSFLAWATGILQNKLSQKSKLPHEEVRGDQAYRILESMSASEQGPSTAAASAEEKALMRRAIETLDQESHQLLLMYWWQGLSQREVGDRLGISENAARKRLARAQSELARAFSNLCGKSL